MAQANEDSALLIMDVQPNIVERIKHREQYMQDILAAVAAAHKLRLQIIYVVVGFRPGLPEISERNQSFNPIRSSDAANKMITPQPAIEPTADDIVVTKRRVSAFTGSDLEVILRAQNITHLVLAGIATSGVVLSTVREAADKDFRLTVLADLCAAFDDEAHGVLTEKIFPRQATVMNSAEWISSLATQSGK